jgi:hypothetical protein
MFVPATMFRAEICPRILTHYKREEDTTMKSGKFDEELARMSRVVDCIVPDTLMLFNESFSSTNEREGSEIGRQIVAALLECKVKVAFVTHQYEFAHGFAEKPLPNVLFLRAERGADGSRSRRVSHCRPASDRTSIVRYSSRTSVLKLTQASSPSSINPTKPAATLNRVSRPYRQSSGWIKTR